MKKFKYANRIISLMIAGFLICGSLQVLRVHASEQGTQATEISTEAEEQLVSDPGLTQPQEVTELETQQDAETTLITANIEDEDTPLAAGDYSSENLMKLILIGIMLIVIAFLAGYGLRIHASHERKKDL